MTAPLYRHLKVSQHLPAQGVKLLVKAASTHSPEEVDAAIHAVRRMYPSFFKKEQ